MIKKILFILIISIPFSCKKNETLNNEPIIPQSGFYDFNNDGINDFATEYRSLIWCGVDNSGMGYSGGLTPLNQNKILFETHYKYLYSKLGDTIKLNPDTSKYWTSQFADFIQIMESYENNYWPQEWSILGSYNSKQSYIGVKIKQNLEVLIGWLKLEINKENGSIQIIDKEFSTKDVVISR